MNEDNKSPEQPDAATAPAYEAPAIEEIIPPDDMEREVHYAGTFSFN